MTNRTRTEYIAALACFVIANLDTTLAEWFEKIEAHTPNIWEYVGKTVPLQEPELQAMFDGESVSDELKAKIETLFQAAVVARVGVQVATIQDKLLNASEDEYKEFIAEQKVHVARYIKATNELFNLLLDVE
jgi:hypothetical protein